MPLPSGSPSRGHVVGLLVVLSAMSACKPQGGTLSVPYPAVQSVGNKTTLTCQPLMEADITGSPDASLTNGIDGKVTSGENGATVTIGNDGTVRFVSFAATRDSDGVGAGTIFTLLDSDATQVVATHFDGRSMNSFVLNKTNGLAIWSKIRSTFPVYGAPTAGVTYMVCR